MLLQLIECAPNNHGIIPVVYSYFDFQNSEKQLAQSLLNSVILQLYDRNVQTFRIVEGVFNSHSRGRTKLAFHDSISVVRRLLENAGLVYLVIDAIDECQNKELVLEFLEELRRWNQGSLYVLVTSRKEPDIEDSLGTVATNQISLEENVLEEDILSYVRHQLHHDVKLSKWSQDTQKEIEDALLKGAHGMFRWVECQLVAVRTCLKLVNLRKTLKSLPKTLDETYARILDAIEEDYVEDARRILSCLIYSFYPLSIQEVAGSIGVVCSGPTFYDTEYRLSEPRDILRICAGLVVTTKSTRTTHMGDRHLPIEELRLAHFSVKEYLVSDRTVSMRLSDRMFEERRTHEFLTNLCIRYLKWCHQRKFCDDPEFLSNYAAVYLDSVPFAPYAAACWSRHFEAARLEGSSPLTNECLEMLTHTDLLRDIIKLHPPWFQYQEVVILQRLGYVKTIGGNYYLDHDFETVPLLYYASLLGLDHLVLRLLEQGEDINRASPEGTCLAAAASTGHASTVQLLMANGTSIDARVRQTWNGESCYTRTAIHEAVYGGHEEVISIMLSQGADVNIGRLLQGKDCAEIYYNTPLQEAIGFFNKRIARLLIDAGADPNMRAGTSGTALEIASQRTFLEGFSDIMAMLLEAGADPNLTSDHSGLRTPLFHIITKKSLPGLQLLLQWNVNWKSIKSHILPFLTRNYRRYEDAVRHEDAIQWAIESVATLRPDIDLEIPLVGASGT